MFEAHDKNTRKTPQVTTPAACSQPAHSPTKVIDVDGVGSGGGFVGVGIGAGFGVDAGGGCVAGAVALLLLFCCCLCVYSLWVGRVCCWSYFFLLSI